MWVTRLDHKQRDVLVSLIRCQGQLGPALAGALEALELARWEDLPEAGLPWDEVVRAAREQGISEADAVWDACARAGAEVKITRNVDA